MRLLRRCILGITAAALPVLCGGVVSHRELLRRELPLWVRLSELRTEHTLCTEQGTETITVCLHDGVLTLCGGTELYRSDDTWFTADCLFSDIDHDGTEEVLLHVWKPGSYGRYKPFWLEKQDDAYTEHLFLYEWDPARADRLDPKWMSSAMPVRGQEVTAEENGDVRILSPDGSVTRWRWESWGLVLLNDA